MTGPVRAAYLHWPFCQQKCAYCDFVSWPLTGSPDRRTEYTACVLREIEAVAAWSKAEGLAAPLESVFFGGGTPSLAEPGQLIALLDALRNQLGLAPDAEITLEANPGTVTVANLQLLRAAGFNRLSLGLQAAQDDLLATLDRIHTVADFKQSVAAARAAGFSRISADLMLGLPGQTLADALASVDLVLELGLDHVSYYALIIEPGTPFYDTYHEHPDALPDDDLERTLYHAVRSHLAEAGLASYEISNAARPGQACRHNLVYWRGEPYYGFGVAAHSYLQGVRRGNTESWLDYQAAYRPVAAASRDDLSQPFAAVISSEIIDTTEARKEMFLLGLRLTEGVAWADFTERFGSDARSHFALAFRRLQDRGLIVCDERGVRLSDYGLDWANQAFAEFV